MDILEHLKKGEVIGFPTETVYGIGAAMSSLSGVARIYQIKNRPLTKPLVAHVSTMEMACSLILEPCSEFLDLARRHWPGALTLIVKKAEWVPDAITSGLPTIGIRMPDDNKALALIDALGEPIIGTSANLSGKSPALNDKEAKLQLGDHVAGYLEGSARLGLASTVYSLVEKSCFREGQIKCLQEHLQKS